MQQMYIKPCRRCNKLFKGIKNALYCDNCRLAMRYVYNKRYYERKKVRANRTLGQQYVCTNCGCKYILASGMQKYCSQCGAKIQDEQHAIRNKTDKVKQYHSNRQNFEREQLKSNNVTRNQEAEKFSGIKIKELRLQKGLSLAEFSRRAGYISHTSFLSHEKNEALNLTLSNFKKIAKVLELDLYELLSYISSNKYTKVNFQFKEHFYNGNNLTKLREQQALSLNKLSTMSGFVATTRIATYEKSKGDEFDKITINSLAYIANALGYTAIELLQKLET